MSGLLLLALVVGQSVPRIGVQVDSVRHEVVITAGPFPLAASGHHGHGEHRALMMPFRWPVAGWVRGFAAVVADQRGLAVSRTILHHLNVINFERRQPVQPAYERLIAVGQETGDIVLPKGIGVPIDPDSRLALLVAWDHDVPDGVEEVDLTLRFKWLPSNTAPAPLSVLPLPVDVGFRPGRTDAFDLPPGVTEKSVEFTLATAGRVLALGGHLHDYGQSLVLADVETGRTLVDLRPRLRDGRVVGMPTKLPGVTGDGIRLGPGRRYRATARYDNPTGETLLDGAMGVLALIFAPDALGRLQPTADDPSLVADLRSLASLDWLGAMPDWFCADGLVRPGTRPD